jgi:hypothetical protein
VQADENQSVDPAEARPLRPNPPQNIDLLAQHEVLCCNRRSRSEQPHHRPTDQSEKVPHSTEVSSESPSPANPDHVCGWHRQPRTSQLFAFVPTSDIGSGWLSAKLGKLSSGGLIVWAMTAAVLATIAAAAVIRSSEDDAWSLSIVVFTLHERRWRSRARRLRIFFDERRRRFCSWHQAEPTQAIGFFYQRRYRPHVGAPAPRGSAFRSAHKDDPASPTGFGPAENGARYSGHKDIRARSSNCASDPKGRYLQGAETPPAALSNQ